MQLTLNAMANIKQILSLMTGILITASLTSCSQTPTTNSTNTSQTTTNTQKPITLTLVSYAVTQSAYEKIIPKFVEEWKAKTGQEVTFNQSYGGSGSQTRAVIDGLEADVVALALALDVQKIEKASLIDAGWEQELPNDSIVHKSVVAFVPRDVNLQIKEWKDLAKPEVQVITANPKTSGGARWNFLGLWGSVTQTGGNTQDAQSFVEKVLKNVPVLPKDAREASDVFFKQKQGNVLLNYENEVILAKQKGEEMAYVVPTDVNISIDSPVTVVDANVKKHGTKEVADAFVKFLFTPEAQKAFAENGFRPIDETVAKEFSAQYPVIKKLVTVKDFGGWATIQTQFFESDAIFDQILNKVGKK